MPLTVPSNVFPSERRALGLAKEGVVPAAPGTPVAPTTGIPIVGFVPEDKPIWLPDESMRAAMAMTYGLIQGPYVADLTFDTSPVYMDTIGHFLLNILGDYTSSGVSTGTTGTLTGTGYPAGQTGSIVVPQGSNFTAGAPGFVQLSSTGTLSEVVGYSSAAGTNIVLSGTTRLAHAAGGVAGSVFQVGGAYTHVFSLLNGTGNAQPPTHTITDRTFIPTFQARWYPFTCMSEMTFTGNAEKLFEWSGKGMGYANLEPGSNPTTTFSTITAEPAWNSTFGLGGTVSGAQIYQIAEWEFILNRVVEPYFTADGAQNPYIIGRGKFSVTGKANFLPTIDETPLTEMLNNTQPQIQVIQTNSLTGTLLESIQFDMQQCAFDASVIEPSKALFGYSNTHMGIANTTNVGNSAGYGPIQVTLKNQTPTF